MQRNLLRLSWNFLLLLKVYGNQSHQKVPEFDILLNRLWFRPSQHFLLIAILVLFFQFFSGFTKRPIRKTFSHNISKRILSILSFLSSTSKYLWLGYINYTTAVPSLCNFLYFPFNSPLLRTATKTKYCILPQWVVKQMNASFRVRVAAGLWGRLRNR